ncbi:MAG: SH3 domain-containing protein [Mageeibacillus sp.]|nr:SH3 domain-containing protein [Mageeibacillus sp.]
MQFRELLNALRPNKQMVIKASSLMAVVILCGLAGFAVRQTLKISPFSNSVVAYAGTSQTTEVTTAQSSAESTVQSSEEQSSIESSAITSSAAAGTSVSQSVTESTAVTETTISEEEKYLTVYASSSLNVRSGPGTEYDVVKSLNPGDEIDVIAVTSNGWYKTYNGNYVSAEHTTDVAPTDTPAPTPTPKPTSASTARSTSATTVATSSATSATATGSNGTSCRITFYGPQDVDSDGVSSLTTATGSTCTQGRTVAADWSIFPAGTTIYIANDPLGGDGYYTVEDKGSGVKGYTIDIYVDDPSSYRSCTRSVTTG